MSYADEVFIANCKDILENGTWDTDYNVRPHWEDGTSAHTIKKFGIVNRYDLSKEFPAMTLRNTFIKSNGRAALDMAEEIEQRQRLQRPCLGLLGRRKRQHRKGIRLSARSQAPLPRGRV